MNTNKIKTYAPKARRDFIAAVTRRAGTFGLTVKGASPVREEGQLVFIEGLPYPRSVGTQRQKLAARVEQHGFAQTMEAAAYTWFNRLIAIRFMELHGYLDHSFRVLSHPGGSALPEILEHAQHLDLPGLDRARVMELKLDGTRDEELYRDLLLAQCRSLHQAMPFLFESVDDETELLLPENLLQTDSLIRELVTAIPEDDWREIEIIAQHCVTLAKEDWDAYECSWGFESIPILTASSEPRPALKSSYIAWIARSRATIAEMKRVKEENNRLFIDAYGLQDEVIPEVPIEQITLTVNPSYRYGKKLGDDEWSVEHGFGEELETRFREDTMQELVSYAIGGMMGRYSLDAPGLIYAHSGNEGFDPSRYARFPADADGILPITDTDWFDEDATHRLVEFIAVAWDQAHLEENLGFLADNLSPKNGESSRETIRRYLSDRFFKDHLQTYKNRPIYWCFSSGKQKAFQCLVYLHRYHSGTLARMRMEYVVPLQSKMAGRIDSLADDIQAASSSAQAKRLQKERDKLTKQLEELRRFDEQLRHHADQRIALDLDDGVKVNYAKFGDLLAEVKAVCGKDSE